LTTTIPAFLVGLFLFAVALFYGLQDGTKLGRWLFRLSPFPQQQTRELFTSVRETVNGALLGLIATALVQGGLTMLALYIFGVPNAFLLGILATILAFTPIIGTVPVTVGSAAYLFMMGRTGAGVGMLVAALIIGVSDNVVRPWVQSTSTSMHPFIALLGIFGGIELFGAAGVFLGPIVAAMAIWTIETYAKLHAQGNRDREAAAHPSTLVVVNAGATPPAEDATPEKPRKEREIDGPVPTPPPSKPLTTAG
jgi:predicted PurR-regulated permease PerM